MLHALLAIFYLLEIVILNYLYLKNYFNIFFTNLNSFHMIILLFFLFMLSAFVNNNCLFSFISTYIFFNTFFCYNLFTLLISLILYSWSLSYIIWFICLLSKLVAFISFIYFIYLTQFLTYFYFNLMFSIPNL